MKSFSRLPCLAISSAMASRDLGPVDGVDGVEQLHGLPRLVGLQRADQVQLDAGDSAARSAGHLALASCTRFSPKQAVAGLEHGQDVLGAERLGDGDEIDRGRVALGGSRPRRRCALDGGEAGGACWRFGHGYVLPISQERG